MAFVYHPGCPLFVIPEGRSLIRDRNKPRRSFFLRSRLALRLAGMTMGVIGKSNRQPTKKSSFLDRWQAKSAAAAARSRNMKSFLQHYTTNSS
jgi:hypothetical protein